MNMKKIKFTAIIDLDNNKTIVKPISKDAWQDWGYCLEICGMMAQQARVKKGYSFEETAEYAKNYILKCLYDYQNQ